MRYTGLDYGPESHRPNFYSDDSKQQTTTNEFGLTENKKIRKIASKANHFYN